MSNFSQSCRRCGTSIQFDRLDEVLVCGTCGTQNLPHEHHTQASISEAAGVEAELFERAPEAVPEGE